MKKWIVISISIIILAAAGYFGYQYATESGSSVPEHITNIPILQPGPDDAYLHYAVMMKDMKMPSDYKTFLKITNPDSDLRTEDIPLAQQILSIYQERLKEMELGAQKKTCTLPIQPLPEGQIPYSLATEYSQANNTFNIIQMQNMGKILLLRERLAVLENRPADAIVDCTLLMQSGRHLNQGLIIYRLIGLSMQANALKGFYKLLSSPTTVSYADTIQKTLAEFSEPVVFDVKDYARYEISVRMNDITGMSPTEKTMLERTNTINLELVKSRYTAVNARYDLCRLCAALRLYQSTHNQEFPPSLKDLSPGVLPQLPIDPFTQKDYAYEVSSDNNSVTLSSPGPGMQTSDQSEQEQIDYMKNDLVIIHLST
jgi:hypothetical protein